MKVKITHYIKIITYYILQTSVSNDLMSVLVICLFIYRKEKIGEEWPILKIEIVFSKNSKFKGNSAGQK